MSLRGAGVKWPNVVASIVFLIATLLTMVRSESTSAHSAVLSESRTDSGSGGGGGAGGGRHLRVYLITNYVMCGVYAVTMMVNGRGMTVTYGGDPTRISDFTLENIRFGGCFLVTFTTLFMIVAHHPLSTQSIKRFFMKWFAIPFLLGTTVEQSIAENQLPLLWISTVMSTLR